MRVRERSLKRNVGHKLQDAAAIDIIQHPEGDPSDEVLVPGESDAATPCLSMPRHRPFPCRLPFEGWWWQYRSAKCSYAGKFYAFDRYGYPEDGRSLEARGQ